MMLLPGEWVEVRAAEEIAATLDPGGCLDGLPFMQEMAAHCGRRFPVQVRAERTCTFPFERNHRRLERAVVLRGLRCDGASHGGCQLGCMMFWKEAWLKRVDVAAPEAARTDAGRPRPEFASRRPDDPSRYLCQATEIVRATTPGPPLWHPAQYLRMWRVGTFTVGELVSMFADIVRRRIERRLGRAGPSLAQLKVPAPAGPLGLEPGDEVIVKSRDGIRATLDRNGMHRGLMFSETMYAFCGRRMKVLARVEQIVDERTGKLRRFAPGTVLLEGSICDRYRGCARNMPIMWREAWLERAETAPRVGRVASGSDAPEHHTATSSAESPMRRSSSPISPR